MAEEIPVIPKVSNILVHSGNIINWNRLKGKPNQTPTEELSECVGATLDSYLSSTDKNRLQYETEIDCVQSKFIETLPKEERGDFKLTVKVFLCSLLPKEVVREAIEKAIKELDVTFVETALIAFPEFEEEDELTLDVIKPYWEVLQDLVHEDKALSLGIADLNKGRLEELFNWADVKPCINQVNLESCCVIPKDMSEFAKQNDIQLLTHNDPKTIMPVKALQDTIAKKTTEKDGENWIPMWALRYSVIVKCRGIIKTKGYIFKAEKDTKKRK